MRWGRDLLASWYARRAAGRREGGLVQYLKPNSVAYLTCTLWDCRLALDCCVGTWSGNSIWSNTRVMWPGVMWLAREVSPCKSGVSAGNESHYRSSLLGWVVVSIHPNHHQVLHLHVYMEVERTRKWNVQITTRKKGSHITINHVDPLLYIFHKYYCTSNYTSLDAILWSVTSKQATVYITWYGPTRRWTTVEIEVVQRTVALTNTEYC